jgi:uncharacterized ferritin-like protein (DUF455 family)
VGQGGEEGAAIQRAREDHSSDPGLAARRPSLRALALAVALECKADAKAALARAVDPASPLDADEVLAEPAGIPGRPARPVLVPPIRLAPRSIATSEGHAALIHALAHIELNAIDLAADACWRFVGMPDAYYRDWAQVMREEALHFELLAAHLATLGHAYGDFPAHDALWQMAERTKHDVLARMALVPRTLEARGLDASPAVKRKLQSAGDPAGAAIIDLILRDEIGHVGIGNRWFAYLCERDGLDTTTAFAELAARHGAPTLKGPFNREARIAAGFRPEEIDALTGPR